MVHTALVKIQSLRKLFLVCENCAKKLEADALLYNNKNNFGALSSAVRAGDS